MCTIKTGRRRSRFRRLATWASAAQSWTTGSGLPATSWAGVAVRREGRALADQRYVSELISLADPAGNRLEAFHGGHVADTPFVPTRDMSGFRTGPMGMGMGHVLLMVPDVDTAFALYRDVPGNDIAQIEERRVAARLGRHANDPAAQDGGGAERRVAFAAAGEAREVVPGHAETLDAGLAGAPDIHGAEGFDEVEDLEIGEGFRHVAGGCARA